jgi:peptidoglycan hydrolase CwlO-like protein
VTETFERRKNMAGNELKNALDTVRNLLRDESASYNAAVARRDYLASAEKTLLAAVSLAARTERAEQELGEVETAKTAVEQEIVSLRRQVAELAPRRSELSAQVADLQERLAAIAAREAALNEREEKITQREEKFKTAVASINT